MEIVSVNNIVPTIFEWAKKQAQDFSGWWEIQEFFSFDIRDNINWDKVAEDKYLGIVKDTPFDGHYDSDEVHDYQILFWNNEIVCISHKVADRSDREFYWVNSEIEFHLSRTLISKYPVINDCSNGDILDEQTMEKISSSQYQMYAKIDEELFALIKMPYWGGLRNHKSNSVLIDIIENKILGKVIKEYPKKVQDNYCNRIYCFDLDNGQYVEIDYWDNKKENNICYATKISL